MLFHKGLKKFIPVLLSLLLLSGCCAPASSGLSALPRFPVFTTSEGIELPEEDGTEGEDELADSTVEEQTQEINLPAVSQMLSDSEKSASKNNRTMRLLPELLSGLETQYAFLYDADNDDLIATIGKDEAIVPASTTKLLTILTALQYLEPDEVVQPGEELIMITEDSSLAGLDLIMNVTVEQLVEGMMLPSGNDAAYTLATAAGRKIAGDPELYWSSALSVMINAMNEYAQELGMTNSYFSRPDGYGVENNYSTPADMALLAAAAADNELIRKYCSIQTDTVELRKNVKVVWTNTNLMLNPDSKWYSPYVKGLKTGSLTENYSLITILEKDGKTYLAGVFGETTKEARYRDTQVLINRVFGEE